jgi:hypothetical protein
MSERAGQGQNHLGVHRDISPPIGQAFAFGAFDGDCSTHGVIDAELGTGVLAEIELGQIAM